MAALPYPAAAFTLDGVLAAANTAFEAHLGSQVQPRAHPGLPSLVGQESFDAFVSAQGADNPPLVQSVRIFMPGAAGVHSGRLSVWPGDPPWLVLHLLAPERQTAIELLPVGLLLVDSDGQVATINPRLADVLEVDQASWIGQPAQPLLELLAERSLEPAIARPSLEQGMIASARLQLALAGPPTRHVQLTFFPLSPPGREQTGWGLLVEDSSQSKDQVAWKVDLLASLAHEMRTPLAGLKGHTTALLANIERWPRSMVIESLEALDLGADQLVRQVDRSLALTRLEAGQLGLRPTTVALHALLASARDRAAPALENLNLELDLAAGLPDIRADPERLEEVIVTLLENAAAQTPAGGVIRVSAEADDSWVTLWVEDQGPPVSAERQSRVFDRTEAQADERAAFGLGLYISRRLIEAHGGRLWLESPAPGQRRGARFWLQLPPWPEAASAAASTEPPPAASARGRILLIAGASGLEGRLQSYLSQAGYLLETTEPAAASERLASQPIDLVLLDLILPSSESLELTRLVRRLTQAPIVALTTPAGSEDLTALFEAGIDDYLTKPFHQADLLARLHANLNLHRPLGEQATEAEAIDGLQIDYPRRQARVDGRRIDLTPTEFELLAQLDRHRGQVMTHGQLIEHLWPTGHGNRHRLFVHINRLRAKLEHDPAQPRFLLTRWGTGYLLS